MKSNEYMRRALELAAKAQGETSPNPMVGAVLVKGGRIIAEGYHKRAGDDHAEIVALKKAGAKAKGATLYVTLEPCAHVGRTPPCVETVIQSGVKEVVIAMKDPNPLTNGKSIRMLRSAGIKVQVGVLEQEAQRLNEVFIKYITSGLPFVVAKSAQTLDGKIATISGQSKWITSEESRDFGHRLRKQFDAICVGITTVLKDNPHLNAAERNRPIKKIILDSRLRIPLNANVFKGTDPSDIMVVTTKDAAKSKRARLIKKSQVIEAPQKHGRIDVAWLFYKLAKEGITSVLIEGGSRVIGSALRQGVVDKCFIFIAPKIIGNQMALSSVDGLTVFHLDQAVQLKNVTVEKINEDLFLQAYVHGNH